MSTLGEIRTMIEECEEHEERLTDWERQFIDSLSKQLANGSFLSIKQDDALVRIWGRVTS